MARLGRDDLSRPNERLTTYVVPYVSLHTRQDKQRKKQHSPKAALIVDTSPPNFSNTSRGSTKNDPTNSGAKTSYIPRGVGKSETGFGIFWIFVMVGDMGWGREGGFVGR